jgi:hypothetical protein
VHHSLAVNLGLLIHCSVHIASRSHSRCRQEGDVAAITAALDAGANINESDGTATPLYYAVLVAQLDAAKLLMERGADVNAVSALGDTPLGPAVARRNTEFIRLLLEHGANPNSAMGGSQNILHFASAQGCLDCVKALVEAGADVNAQTSDSKYRTPLHLAKRRGFQEVADYLMSMASSFQNLRRFQRSSQLPTPRRAKRFSKAIVHAVIPRHPQATRRDQPCGTLPVAIKRRPLPE